MITKNEVKYIQSLAHQKKRNEERVFLAEGIKLVEDLVKYCPDNINTVYATENYAPQLQQLIADGPVHIITEDELARISQMQSPNQVLAVVRQFDFAEPLQDADEWLLVLDGIQDPGNMGTIIRLADWFGIKNILSSPDCVDVYNSKVVQASMGSIARVGVHCLDVCSWLKGYRHSIVGAQMRGTPLNAFSFPKAGILVIGSEGKGIRHEMSALLTDSITIPSFGQAESLNAGTATGIILWELRK
jgi:TrmH family RNA methyltransferase